MFKLSLLQAPKEGVLEFDFVSFVRPPADAVAATEEEFGSFYKKVLFSEPLDAEHEMQIAGVKAAHNFGDVDQGAEAMISVLRWTSTHYYLTARQIRHIMCLFPLTHPAR